MKEWSISSLGKEVGLSRSTLLYYDEIGLLRPDYRESSGYRFYSETNLKNLRRICELKEAGFSLKEIQGILEKGGDPNDREVEVQIRKLNEEVRFIRQKQRLLGGMLKHKASQSGVGFGKDSWMDILQAAGIDDEPLDRFHVEFERRDPDAHRDFLTSLGIAPAEIEEIQNYSRLRLGEESAGA